MSENQTENPPNVMTRTQGTVVIVLLLVLVAGTGVLAAVTIQPEWSLKRESGPRYADKVRDYRRALWRVASFTEVGLNLAKHSELVGDANFEHNAAVNVLADQERSLPSWRKLDEVLAAYRDAGSAWNESIQNSYGKEEADTKRQAAWSKASQSLIEAEKLLREGK